VFRHLPAPEQVCSETAQIVQRCTSVSGTGTYCGWTMFGRIKVEQGA